MKDQTPVAGFIPAALNQQVAVGRQFAGCLNLFCDQAVNIVSGIGVKAVAGQRRFIMGLS